MNTTAIDFKINPKIRSNLEYSHMIKKQFGELKKELTRGKFMVALETYIDKSIPKSKWNKTHLR